MNPLLTPKANEQPPSTGSIDPAVLAALIAAMRPTEALTITEPQKPPIVISILALFLPAAAVGALFALVYADDPSDKTAIAIALGVLLTLTAIVIQWFSGSSIGSWVKNFKPQPMPPPAPPIVVPPEPKPEPEPEPGGQPKPPLPPDLQGIGPSTRGTTSVRNDIPPVSGEPASIRYNNPGAQYPSIAAEKFGQIGYGVIGGGHKIARFPHPVNGAAANFDLLRRNYVGMTIGDARDKWTGGGVSNLSGYDPNATLTAEIVDNQAQAIPLMKAIARWEAGKESPLTDAQWRAAHEMFKAGSADAWLVAHGSGAPTTAPTGSQIDIATKIIDAMRRKGYVVDTQPGEINIVYVEGLNEDGTVNDDAADKWNDLRVVIGFEDDKPVILGKWLATTEPGAYYTEHPVNPAGAARIEFGQYQAWRVGMHRGDHEALVQRGKVTVCRDLNKDMIRTGDARDTGDNFGINQHGPSGTDEDPDSVGKFSAGCLVGKTMAGHRAFMAIVKADPRFIADPDYMFRTAILAERDVIQ